MTTFQFLHPEFRLLLEPAKGAEQLVHSDSRASCMGGRGTGERARRWSHEEVFKASVPSGAHSRGLDKWS